MGKINSLAQDEVEQATESYLNDWINLDQAQRRLQLCGYEPEDAVDYLTTYKDARLQERN